MHLRADSICASSDTITVYPSGRLGAIFGPCGRRVKEPDLLSSVWRSRIGDKKLGLWIESAILQFLHALSQRLSDHRQQQLGKLREATSRQVLGQFIGHPRRLRRE